MWKEYFGPQSHIYGVDIQAACKVYEDERTRVFIGDQADRRFWRDFRKQVPQIDILIDDGGHQPEQQIVTLEEMLPYIKAGGVYLCEDVHGVHNRFAAYIYGITDALNALEHRPAEHFASNTSSFQRYIYTVHFYPFVIVIEKAQYSVTYFVAPKHGTEWQAFR